MAYRGGAQQAAITGREGVGFGECAHGDVLRGPIADSRQLAKPGKERADVDNTRE